VAADADPLRLPWTGEFSPGQLGDAALLETLRLVAASKGQRDAIVEAIRSRWFAEAAASRADPGERLGQQRTRAGNVLNGMQNYGLVDSSYLLTEIGASLLAEPDDFTRNGRFAEFLLKHRRGFDLLDIVRDLQQRRTVITNVTLRDELRRRGYLVTTNSGDAGKLRQWLATAGIFSKGWTVNEQRVAEVSGMALGVVADWQSLTRPQRAFLTTMRRLSETRGKRPISSPELLDFVREEHGPVFDEGQVRKIYQALAQGGWVEHSVKSGGRGGKGGMLAATDKLIDVDFELLVGFKPGDLPADLRAAMTTPLVEIYAQLESSDTYLKGIALELLAVNLATDLGLTPLSLRVRGVRTGGAEVDLVAEAAHLHFTRWLFQCKNTRAVDVGVLAKEVGMATLLQAQVIVIATTGSVSKTVVAYASRVTETTPFQVVLIDGKVLKSYREGGALALRETLHTDASQALQLKRPQVLETLQDLVDDEA
jgi:hypothetical protein